eukprot:1154939-Pelagomonas_calceolata.AAC.4
MFAGASTTTYPVLLQEHGLLPEGPDGDQAVQRLRVVLEDGAEGQRVQALQLSAAGNVHRLHRESKRPPTMPYLIWSAMLRALHRLCYERAKGRHEPWSRRRTKVHCCKAINHDAKAMRPCTMRSATKCFCRTKCKGVNTHEASGVSQFAKPWCCAHCRSHFM